jgi:HSP20 family protein
MDGSDRTSGGGTGNEREQENTPSEHWNPSVSGQFPTRDGVNDVTVLRGQFAVYAIRNSSTTYGISVARYDRCSFARTMVLPDTVDIEKISAEFEKGVLHIIMPKTEPKEPSRKIKVSSK